MNLLFFMLAWEDQGTLEFAGQAEHCTRAMSWPTGFAQLFCASILHRRIEANLLHSGKWRQLFSNSHQAFVGEEAKCGKKVP